MIISCPTLYLRVITFGSARVRNNGLSYSFKYTEYHIDWQTGTVWHGDTHFPTLSYSLAFLCFPFIAWFIYHSPPLTIYSPVLLLIPLLKYIPRIIEMRRNAGSWKHVIYHRNLKDRL